MSKVLVAPGKYIQGAGELKNLGEHIINYGKKALVIVSKNGKERLKSSLEEIDQTAVELRFELFCGECTVEEVKRLTEIVKEENCEVIVGIGGGKILDTGKAIAHYLKKPVILCPTTASTNAPCSPVSVLYTPEGKFAEYLSLPMNPNLILVDTEEIVKAPIRLSVAGMGEVLATYYEGKARKSGMTEAAYAMAEQGYKILIEEGVKARIALEEGVCTKAVDKVIEANTLLSGMGFVSDETSGAHAIYNGFTMLDDSRKSYHGEKLAFSTIVWLVLENAPEEEIGEVVEFCLEVGLPVTLADLGMKRITDEKIEMIAEAAKGDNEAIGAGTKDIVAAIKAADGIGRYFKG